MSDFPDRKQWLARRATPANLHRTRVNRVVYAGGTYVRPRVQRECGAGIEAGEEGGMSDVITPYIPGNAPVICAQCQYSCHGYGGAMLCRHPFATSVSEITGDTLYRSCAYMRGRKCKDGALFEEKPASWWHRLFRRST